MSRKSIFLLLAVFLLTEANSSRADIFRWDNGEVIPGTEGFTPGPGMTLSGWFSESHNLRYANFSGDLTGSTFKACWLENARFINVNLTGSSIGSSTLSNTNFTGANLTDVSFGSSTLTGVIFTGAVVHGTNFYAATSRGFTSSQLYSTQSYLEKDLTGISLGGNDLTGWDLHQQDITDARLNNSVFTDVNLAGALVAGANFQSTTELSFTAAQLYSTQSYQAKNLDGMNLSSNDLAGWDFNDQNLTAVSFRSSTLLGTDLSGAAVMDTNFADTTSGGFTAAQLYSTSSYQAGNLSGIALSLNDLTGWDLSEQNLTGASLSQSVFTSANLTGTILTDAYLGLSTLTNANLTGAVITEANFDRTTSRGFTAAQLYSTLSYQAKNLTGISLRYNNLAGWDFGEQNLTLAELYNSTLTNANLTGANLTNALLSYATLSNANLTGTNLTNAYMRLATLMNTDLTSADTRGARFLDLTGAISQNTILPDGSIVGLSLALGDKLVVRDDDGVADSPPQYWLEARSPIPITIQEEMTLATGGVLQLLFDTDPWDSLISFDPGIPVQLGGTLELSFASEVDLASQVGRTLQIFDWQGVNPMGQFEVASLYDWDLSQLYSTGEVTLQGIEQGIGGDFDQDSDVDGSDFLTWQRDPSIGELTDWQADFGTASGALSASTAVPEPATMWLAVAGAGGIGALLPGIRRRSKRRLAKSAPLI